MQVRVNTRGIDTNTPVVRLCWPDDELQPVETVLSLRLGRGNASPPSRPSSSASQTESDASSRLLVGLERRWRRIAVWLRKRGAMLRQAIDAKSVRQGSVQPSLPASHHRASSSGVIHEGETVNSEQQAQDEQHAQDEEPVIASPHASVRQNRIALLGEAN